MKTLYFPDHPDFTPNYTPREVLEKGSFGGGYFRPIYCTLSKKTVEEDYHNYQWSKDIPSNKLTNATYDLNVNCYKVRCGTSLELWQQKKWIRIQDPRGWFEWYCRFYEGRRTEDDLRQIGRWKRINRFKSANPSLVVKQVLLHWAVGLEC